MVKDYKYYKNLPELDEAKIEALSDRAMKLMILSKRGRKAQ